MLGSAIEEKALRATRTPEELGDSLIRGRHELDVLELMWSLDAAHFAATDEYDRQGWSSPYDWLRFSCHMTTPQVLDRVAVGEQVARMPESVQAMMTGEIGFAHLMVIANTADALRESKTAATFDEKMVLEQARENSAGRLRQICRHLRHALDAPGYAAAEAEVVEMRELKISSGGEGMVSVKGYLDSMGAAILRNALEPLARKSGKEDKRKRERRLADALVELATGARPAQLQVTASFETLKGMAGAPAAEMPFSLPISARTVERMACDCSLTRVLLDADSTVVDVGRATPRVSASMRRALRVRDRGCRWPGCDRPAYWSECHHFVHWVNGGPTELDNLVLLCYHHHRNVHEGNWQLVKCDDGRLLTIPPPTLFGLRPRGPD